MLRGAISRLKIIDDLLSFYGNSKFFPIKLCFAFVILKISYLLKACTNNNDEEI